MKMLNVSKICTPLNIQDTKIKKKAVNKVCMNRKSKLNAVCSGFLLKGTNNLLFFLDLF